MAFRTQKISQMTPKGSDLEATDLLEVSTIESGSYVTRSITGQEIIDAAVGNVDWGDIGGTLSDQTDLNTALSGKVPTTRTLTINGTTQDLSADRTFTISTGITIGTTAITSGTVGRVLFEGTGNVVQESANLFWDNTNGRLGIGTSSPLRAIDVFASFPEIATRIAGNGTGKFSFLGNAGGEIGAISLTGSSGEMRMFTSNSYFPTFYSSGSEAMRIATTRNVLINTTTDAGFKLDVNGTARVQGDLTIQNNSSLSWGNGNFVQVNNATPDWKFYVQSSLILTVAQSSFTIAVSANTRALNPSGDNTHDIGSQFGRYRNGWFAAKLKVGDATAFDASAKLQVDSTTLGFLPPRMTTTQKNAIATPTAGLVVYDSTLNKLCVRTASAWETITSI